MSDPFHWPGPDLRRAVLAGLAYFTVVFATGFLLGTLRAFLLIPWLGETAAVAIELPVILTVAWIACRRLIAWRRFRGSGQDMSPSGRAFCS